MSLALGVWQRQFLLATNVKVSNWTAMLMLVAWPDVMRSYCFARYLNQSCMLRYFVSAPISDVFLEDYQPQCRWDNFNDKFSALRCWFQHGYLSGAGNVVRR